MRLDDCIHNLFIFSTLLPQVSVFPGMTAQLDILQKMPDNASASIIMDRKRLTLNGHRRHVPGEETGSLEQLLDYTHSWHCDLAIGFSVPFDC